MKLVVCCLCLCLFLAGVAGADSPSPVPVISSFWEDLARYTGWIFPRPEPSGVPDATFNTFGLSYQCMDPNTFNIASLYMENTGTMTWSEADQIRLGAVGESGGDAAKFGPLRVPIETGREVLPGQRYEFQIPLTAPQMKGSYSPSWRMIREGHGAFGDTATIPVQVTNPCQYPELSDVWSGWYVPALSPGEMTAGQTLQASIWVMNTGTMIWNESGGVRLGAVGDGTGDAAKFGVGRVLLPAGVDVKGIVNNQAVEDRYLFTFTITAPQTPGRYKPAFRMVREPGGWFGPTLTVPIEVKAPPGPIPQYNSSIVSWTAPDIQNGKAAPGRQIYTYINIMNTGSETWYSTYYRPYPFWSNGDVGLSNDAGRIDPVNLSGPENIMFGWMKNGFPGRDCYPGDTCQFWFRLTTPASPGTYDMHFRMARLLTVNTTWGFGENLTIPLQVVNASFPLQIPAGLNRTSLEPGLNFQISGGSGPFHALPAEIPLLPASGGGQTTPAATTPGVAVTLRPVGTIAVVPAGTTTPGTPSVPVSLAVKPVSAGIAAIRLFPRASFSVTPASGTAPLAVTCDASGSTAGEGTIQSYAWDLGDGITAEGARVTHTYSAAGNYTVTLAVTDSSGRAATAMQQVSVTPAVVPVVVHSIPASRLLRPL